MPVWRMLFLRFRRKSHELQKETLSKVSLRCLKEESTITKLVLAYSFDCKPTYKYHLSVSLKVLIRIGPRPGLSITKCNRSKDITLWPANSNLMTHLTPACEHGLWLIPGFLYYIHDSCLMVLSLWKENEYYYLFPVKNQEHRLNQVKIAITRK